MKVKKLLFGIAEVQPNFANEVSKVQTERNAKWKSKKILFDIAEVRPNFSPYSDIIGILFVKYCLQIGIFNA